MTRFNRWTLVAVGLVIAVASVVGYRARPVAASQTDAGSLLARIEQAQEAPYSGYVETHGTLLLPVADRFTDVGALFGERTRMRVWWRDDETWRVDKLLTAGEVDLIHDGLGTTEWNFEKAEATRYLDPPIRLPRTADLLPPALGRRVLEDVDEVHAESLEARRVAGRTALGLRVSPASPLTSIDHVDLWADSESAITLRVEVFVADDPVAVFTSEFREFSAARPPVERVSFTAPPGSTRSFDDILDIADAANQYADEVPPRTLLGLPLSPKSEQAVGIYGSGLTQVMAIPVWDRAAVPLREQLATNPDTQIVNGDTFLHVGPLGVLLTDEPDGDGWLVTGTINQAALTRAAAELASLPWRGGHHH
jgi:hypothetical protein